VLHTEANQQTIHCTCIMCMRTACGCVIEYLNTEVGAEIEVVVSGMCNASVYNSPCWNIATLPHLE